MEYARWMEEQDRRINDLRMAVNSHANDTDLHTLVEGIMSHYDEVFKLKGIAAKTDVFHMLSGMWKTPAERCFLWLGGFRMSELLKVMFLFILYFVFSMLFPFLDQITTELTSHPYNYRTSPIISLLCFEMRH